MFFLIACLLHLQQITLNFIAIQFQEIGKVGQENRFSPSLQIDDQFIALLFNVKSEIDFVPGSNYFVMDKEDTYHYKAYE